MKQFLKYFILLFILFLNSSVSLKKVNYTDAKNNNVCKELTGEILVYFIFVDSKETSPWTEFDIQSTIDSLDIAIRWMENQARQRSKYLKIKTDYYIGNEFTTITKNLPNGSVIASATEPNLKTGLNELNKWADNIARSAGQSFNIKEKDGIPDIKSPRDKERLIAFLRDENNVESVALLFLVNNYFRTDISIPVNTFSTDDVEFGIISYKYPSVIAHNIMHLYGAADLFATPYRRNEKNIKELSERYPDDIMQDVYGKTLGELNIGAYTEFLIGWRDVLSPELKPYLTDKFYNF